MRAGGVTTGLSRMFRVSGVLRRMDSARCRRSLPERRECGNRAARVGMRTDDALGKAGRILAQRAKMVERGAHRRKRQCKCG